MIPKAVLTEDERKADSFAKYVTEKALNKALKLSTAPTTSNLILPEGEIGYVDGVPTTIYIRIEDAVYKWSLTEST